MTTPTTIQQIQGLADRLARAKDILQDGRIEPIAGIGSYFFYSASGNHVVTPDGRCNCPDYQYRFELHKGWCKHRLAAKLLEENPQGRGDNSQVYAAAA